jgi:hypothetical protein
MLSLLTTIQCLCLTHGFEAEANSLVYQVETGPLRWPRMTLVITAQVFRARVCGTLSLSLLPMMRRVGGVSCGMVSPTGIVASRSALSHFVVALHGAQQVPVLVTSHVTSNGSFHSALSISRMTT